MTENFTFTASDGTLSANQVVTVTLNGTNDAAVIAGVHPEPDRDGHGADTRRHADHQRRRRCCDLCDAEQRRGERRYGKSRSTLPATGEPTPPTRARRVRAGTTYTDTLTVAAADGTRHVLTVNILGTNDAAVVAGVDTEGLTETDTVLMTGGTLTISDVDGTATFGRRAMSQGAPATARSRSTLPAAGPTPPTRRTTSSSPGRPIPTRSTVAAADGTTHVLTVNILGTNDAAVFSGRRHPEADRDECGAVAPAGR